MNRVDAADLLLDFVDVNLDVDLVDADLVGLLFVVLTTNTVFAIFESLANTNNALLGQCRAHEYARTLSFKKTYPTH